MSVVVVVSLVPLAEHRDDVVAAFCDTIEAVHAEDGCEKYALHDNGDRLVLIEKWTDQAALDAHRSKPALAQLGARLEGKLASRPETVVLRPHPAGTPGQGML